MIRLLHSSTLNFLIGAFGFMLGACGNPSFDDLENSELPGVPLADPSIWLEDTTYYAYGTSSSDGIKVYSSTNLYEWIEYQTLALHKNDSYGKKEFWAPEITYNTSLNKFLLYYSAEQHMCVARSDSPLGPFKQEIKCPMSDLWAVDHSVFQNDEGRVFMYYSTNFAHNYEIWACELTNEGTQIKDGSSILCFEAKEIWESSIWPVVEGPYVIEYKGLYYMIYSGSGYQSHDYAIGYAVAEHPLGPWIKYSGNPILKMPKSNGHTLYGTGHGSIFTDRDGNLRLVFHAHYSKDQVHPRQMYIVSVHFTDESTPRMYFGNDIIRPICIGTK